MSKIFNSNNAYYLDQSIKKETQKEIEKLFDKEDVFNETNAEDAKLYLGKEGYFVDVLYKNLNEWKKGILDKILDKSVEDTTIYPSYPFVKLKTQGDTVTNFRFFLPADKVKEVEEPKKYRPFRTTEEFSNVTGKRIGSILKFKYVDKDVCYYTRMYTGFHFLENGNIYIELGSEAYSLEQLYNYYEWLDEHGEWQPFGVEE